MALRDRIANYQPVATATLATLATVHCSVAPSVAEVATVAVAYEENKENDPVPTVVLIGKTIPENAAKPTDPPNTPKICTNCERLEIVEIMGRPVSGCLYTAHGDYPDGWRRLPDGLKKCIRTSIKSHTTGGDKEKMSGVHQLENIKGFSWINQNRISLREAGFTDNDFYDKHPTGISLLKLWEKDDLSVVLEGGTIFFRWKDASGKIITQTCSPERQELGEAVDFLSAQKTYEEPV